MKADRKENQYGGEAEERPMSRAAKKLEEQAVKRAKKAESRRLAELEQDELVRLYDVKLTSLLNYLEKLKKKEEDQRLKEKEEKKRNDPQAMDATEYLKIVGAVENVNQDGVEVVDTTIVEAKLRSMVSGRNKEATNIALFNAYQKEVLPGLQLEKPGLTQEKYLDMVLKQWRRSPKNPENRGMTEKDVVELRINEHFQRMKKVPNKVRDGKTVRAPPASY